MWYSQTSVLSLGVGTGVSEGGGTTPPVVEDGVNLFKNSKLSGGGSSTAPTNWVVYQNDSPYVFSASALADHFKCRFQSGASDYSDQVLIEQSVAVEAGLDYTFSAYVTANDGAASADHVVLNHIPFDSADLVTARPVIDDATPGTRVAYTLRPKTTGNLRLLMGLDRTGDVTLERPMFDQSSSSRTYVATDPETPPATGFDLESIPYDGIFEGWPKIHSSNNSNKLNGTNRGYRFLVRRDGTISEVHYQLASNFSGETSKSAVGGSTSHSYPASWDLTFKVWRANSSWQKTGSAVFTENFIYTNSTGNPSAGGDSRVIMAHDNIGLSVTTGDRLIFEVSSRESSPASNYCSLNAPSVISSYGTIWVGTGASPAEASGLFHGDGNLHVSIGSTNTSPSNGMQYGCAVRYSDTYEDGDLSFDCTPSAFTASIYGSTHKVRQTWSATYYRRASGILVGAWHRTTSTPGGPLRVEISGSDISTVTVDIPASQISAYNSTYRMREVALSSPLTLSPGTTYTVTWSSPSSSSSNGYQTTGCRSHGYLGAPTVAATINGTRMNPPPASYSVIDRHDWSGTAVKTTDNFSTSTILGWSGGGGNISFALRLDGNVSDTLGGLS